MRPFHAPTSVPFAVAAALLTAVGGCSSNWDLAAGEQLEYGCTGNLNWYPDCDRDGFGTPLATPIDVDCEANLDEEDVANAGCQSEDGKRIPLASNQLDCDPNNSDITANAGSCPPAIGQGEYPDANQGFVFVEEPSGCVRGLVAGDTEYVATCGNSPQLTAQRALSSCEQWAGSLRDPLLPETEGFGGLARIRTASTEFTALLVDLAESNVSVLWLDLSWDHQADRWTYDVGNDEELGEIPVDFPPCPGPDPSLADVWVEVNPTSLFQDSDGDSVPDRIEREVGTDPADPQDVALDARGVDRLALIRQDSGEWCWGAPSRFELEPRLAYALCQRPAPDPVRYAEAPIE